MVSNVTHLIQVCDLHKLSVLIICNIYDMINSTWWSLLASHYVNVPPSYLIFGSLNIMEAANDVSESSLTHAVHFLYCSIHM